MGMSDFAFSMQMRDTIAKLVATHVEKLRPKYRYGVVESIDAVANKCSVIFNGETSSVIVNMGSIVPSAVGQTVRIDGLSNDRFVADVIGPSAGGGSDTIMNIMGVW